MMKQMFVCTLLEAIFQIQLRSNGLKNDTLVIAMEMSYRHDPGPTLIPQVWLTQP